jgi:hypothetical protein
MLAPAPYEMHNHVRESVEKGHGIPAVMPLILQYCMTW